MLNEMTKKAVLDSQDYVDLEDIYGTHHYKPLDVVLDRGEGVWVFDVEGKKYLDCLSAYSAVSQPWGSGWRFSHPGRFSSTVTLHKTCVPPNLARTEPSAYWL